MTITEKYILFFGKDWPSNFAESPITVWDDFQWTEEQELWDEPHLPSTITFKTAEAYYQSRKAVMAGDKYSYYKIALAQSPAETKGIARHIKLNPKEWDAVRVKYMWETLQLKFKQNPDILKKFLDPAIDNKQFVEASPYDCFWGAGVSESTLAREIEEFGRIEWFDYVHDVPVSINMLGNLLNKLRGELK